MSCKLCKGTGYIIAPGRAMRANPCPECRGLPKKKKNKFHAVLTEFGGLKFGSKREAARFAELQIAAACGEISGLRPHPAYRLQNDHITVKYPNGRVAKYTADSEYTEAGELITEDVKSRATMTEAAKLRIAVFESIYGRSVRIVE